MEVMKPFHRESKDIIDQARDTKASFVYPQAKTKSAGNMDQWQLIFFFLVLLWAQAVHKWEDTVL